MLQKQRAQTFSFQNMSSCFLIFRKSSSHSILPKQWTEESTMLQSIVQHNPIRIRNLVHNLKAMSRVKWGDLLFLPSHSTRGIFSICLFSQKFMPLSKLFPGRVSPRLLLTSQRKKLAEGASFSYSFPLRHWWYCFSIPSYWVMRFHCVRVILWPIQIRESRILSTLHGHWPIGNKHN